CDIEAHTFADDSGKFAAAGATIIGVSLDSIARLDDFSADPKYCAGKFPTASDASGAITRSYGLKVHAGRAGLKDVRGVEIGHAFAERTTFIITPDGKIARTIGGVAPAENVAQALEAVQHLHRG
ncbi:MAG: redoxin domain-containing protein, partial [Steroidobacteraceae bacterium]